MQMSRSCRCGLRAPVKLAKQCVRSQHVAMLNVARALIMRTARRDDHHNFQSACRWIDGPACCLQYDVGDCRSMPQYEDAAFVAVIDKGTLDAIMCGECAVADAAAMVSECHRYTPAKLVFWCFSLISALLGA